jgi:hypothetical protein
LLETERIAGRLTVVVGSKDTIAIERLREIDLIRRDDPAAPPPVLREVGNNSAMDGRRESRKARNGKPIEGADEDGERSRAVVTPEGRGVKRRGGERMGIEERGLQVDGRDGRLRLEDPADRPVEGRELMEGARDNGFGEEGIGSPLNDDAGREEPRSDGDSHADGGGGATLEATNVHTKDPNGTTGKDADQETATVSGGAGGVGEVGGDPQVLGVAGKAGGLVGDGGGLKLDRALRHETRARIGSHSLNEDVGDGLGHEGGGIGNEVGV